MEAAKIYRITNNLNGKAYIGYTTQTPARNRWTQHKSNARNKLYQSPLYNAINKYGENNFSFEVFAKCPTKESISTIEKAFISIFNTHTDENGYNIQLGGDYCGKHDSKTKDKMSKSWYESRYDDHVRPVDKYDLDGNLIESYESILEAKKDIGSTGGVVSQVCQGKELTCGGYVYRYEGDPFNKYPIKGKTTPKPVVQIDAETNEVINEFGSIADANRYLGKENNSNISKVCRGIDKYNTAYGYKWAYKNEVTLR